MPILGWQRLAAIDQVLEFLFFFVGKLHVWSLPQPMKPDSATKCNESAQSKSATTKVLVMISFEHTFLRLPCRFLSGATTWPCFCPMSWSRSWAWVTATNSTSSMWSNERWSCRRKTGARPSLRASPPSTGGCLPITNSIVTRRTSGEGGELLIMPLTRSFRETVQARARRDVKFRQALLAEAMQALRDGDLEEGRAALRSYINATAGISKEPD